MPGHFIAALEFSISAQRLAPYRANGEDEINCLANYLWNVELSESLYPALQAFEIALRNATHAALSDYAGTEDWFERIDHQDRQLESIQNAKSQLLKVKKDLDPGRIIAELHFGFWHSLYNRPYQNAIWDSNRGRALQIAFPNIPRPLRNRDYIWKRINEIRLLRNRVFHFEPIWKLPRLQVTHTRIHETLAWISDEAQGVAMLSDRFDQVYASKSEIEQKLREHIGG